MCKCNLALYILKRLVCYKTIKHLNIQGVMVKLLSF